MPALYQKGPLFFCWLGTRQIPTLGKENLHQRKFEPATSTVENPPSTSGPKPYRRKATSARYTTVLVWELVYHAPKIGSGLPEKPWGEHRKTIFKASKRDENKGKWQSPSKCNSKREQQKNTLVNIDVPVVCPCVCVCVRVRFSCQCPYAFASCMFHTICTRENFETCCNIKNSSERTPILN